VETPVIVIHDTDLEALAILLEADVITAKPGAFTIGKQYANGQVATIQRTIEGAASENLARFERYGITWRVLELTQEAASVLDKVGQLATRGTNWREAFKKMGIAGPTIEQQDAIQDDNLSRLRHEC
jgi:hypothetical protein